MIYSGENKVYVVGHKNPDTDSICSAIAYANLKQQLSEGETYIPKRLGLLNSETEYVLNRFGPTNDFSFKNVSREYLLKHNG